MVYPDQVVGASFCYFIIRKITKIMIYYGEVSFALLCSDLTDFNLSMAEHGLGCMRGATCLCLAVNALGPPLGAALGKTSRQLGSALLALTSGLDPELPTTRRK